MRPKHAPAAPPNGGAGTATNPITELIDVMPVRRDRAAARPARRRRVNTADPRPYGDAFASRTASASDGTGVTVTVGPKVSSRTAALSSGTSTSTTGAMNGGFTASRPPPTGPPPRATAAARGPSTPPACHGSAAGPHGA